MTGADVVKASREFILQDIDSSNRRFSDPEAIFWLNEANKELYRFKPDAFYKTSIVTSQPTKITDLTTTLEADESYEGYFVNYLTYRFFNKDSEDPDSRSRAIDFLKLSQNYMGV